MLLSNGLAGTATAVRTPLLRVLAGGAVVAGAFDAEVLSNNHYASDSFRVGLALSADPVHGAAWWAAQDEVLIDVEVSLGGGYVNLVHGTVDTVEIDPVANTVRLCGRDLSARLIEARTQQTLANQSASDIASAFAAEHGLSADVQATTAPVGRYWQLEHDRIVLGGLARATTEWDLLVALAQYEGFDVWVDGTTLHFRPPPAASAPVVVDVAELCSLRLERALTLAGEVAVTVKSWHSRTAQSCAQTASSGQGGGRRQSFVYITPNLTSDVALKLAQQRLAELTRRELVIVAEMPGELSLAPRQQMLLQGSGTAFDRAYRVNSVERRISAVHGFTQVLRASNAAAGN